MKKEFRKANKGVGSGGEGVSDLEEKCEKKEGKKVNDDF